MNRAMRSVFGLGAGNLVSKLETKNSVTFSEFRGGLNREVKEKSFLVCLLVYLPALEALMESSIYIWGLGGNYQIISAKSFSLFRKSLENHS